MITLSFLFLWVPVCSFFAKKAIWNALLIINSKNTKRPKSNKYKFYNKIEIYFIIFWIQNFKITYALPIFLHEKCIIWFMCMYIPRYNKYEIL